MLYIAVAYLLMGAACLGFWLSGGKYQSVAGGVLGACCMLFPLLATMVAQAVEHKPLLRDLGISWKINRWWFAGWLVVPFVVLLAALFTWVFAGSDFTLHTIAFQRLEEQMKMGPAAIVAVTAFSGMVAGITVNALVAFGEEVGWRGYLLRQFAGCGFLKTAVLTGIVWGLWHAPIILLGHNYPNHPVSGVFFMVVLCVLLSVIIQYFRIKSGSVLVAAVMHGTFNALAGMVLFFVENPNELLMGMEGAAGFLSMALVAVGLFLFDRYVTLDNIFTSPVLLQAPQND
ncbi:MAG: CPBP family intramembrane metalloprotease [Bacteroidales bacterium]|nr:CPBP family intramembrane metalloprotease [Bacteroidales bacterium]